MAEDSTKATYDCMVLSGGGAKGAYGAGAAKAVHAYRDYKGIMSPVCYIGASAGALNAYILASSGPDALIAFWRKITKASVLGTDAKPSITRIATRLRRRGPFSIYDNTNLEKLIWDNARLGDLKSPLIIAVTDYTTGDLKAFYSHPLIEDLVREDAKRDAWTRRLAHLRRIESDKNLVHALLASAAIPVYFPPVEITYSHSGTQERGWFIDGGVGNNTPTREAAYFFRLIERLKVGHAGTVYCVVQESPRTFLDGDDRMGILEIFKRTTDVYQSVHTTPIVNAWSRINDEVEEQHQRVEIFGAWLAGVGISKANVERIHQKAEEIFARLGGRAPRVSAPFVAIKPSTDLGDFLNFTKNYAETLIAHGYTDALATLARTPDPAHPGQMLLDKGGFEVLAKRRLW